MSPAEQACIAQGAQVAGADPATVTVTPVASTKEGDTIYTVVAGGVAYNCVASPDGTRRPYWLIRPVKPSRDAYRLPPRNQNR